MSVVGAGSAAAPRRGSRLAREAALHGDLVVGNFTDSRRNASLRALSMLEWALDRCPLAPFIMKVEDHVFVNVPNVLRFVEHHKYEVRTAWGSLAREAGGEYLRGDAYILTADLAGALLRRVWREAYSPHEARFVWRLLAGAAAAAAHEPGLAAPPPAPARALAVPRVPFKGALALWEQLYH
ncbi:hypothetical protein JYU34_020752 [Plutella xylostella]|uniref:Hexosyltransferase n=1 Tax=Plutella xylostella TaxID=51655 RepID=A0ABQ7PVA6_PLUXY|nr:hypothetical protein JYU34_020752 [Plutella xylostella]